MSIAPYDVTRSQFTGASINAVTRSGDKHLKDQFIPTCGPNHSQAIRLTETMSSAPTERSSQKYGFRLGGPIIKNKLFFCKWGI